MDDITGRINGSVSEIEEYLANAAVQKDEFDMPDVWDYFFRKYAVPEDVAKYIKECNAEELESLLSFSGSIVMSSGGCSADIIEEDADGFKLVKLFIDLVNAARVKQIYTDSATKYPESIDPKKQLEIKKFIDSLNENADTFTFEQPIAIMEGIGVFPENEKKWAACSALFIYESLKGLVAYKTFSDNPKVIARTLLFFWNSRKDIIKLYDDFSECAVLQQ